MKRTAIITGGSNGIGRAAVRMMAAKGIDVLLSYYSDEKARDSLLEELKDAPGHVSAVRADVGTRKGVQAIFDAAVETLGSIDILFNNAGVFLDSTFLTATEANLDRTLDVIVKGTFFLTQLVAKHMIERQIRGRIINTSSSVTKDQSSQPLDYCIAKAGINIMTTALARELGPYGIPSTRSCPARSRRRSSAGSSPTRPCGKNSARAPCSVSSATRRTLRARWNTSFPTRPAGRPARF